VTQLAAQTRIATFIALILFHGPFASILVPRFVYGNNLNALDHTMSQFFMCHCIPSDQATQIIGPNIPSRILPFATISVVGFTQLCGRDWLPTFRLHGEQAQCVSNCQPEEMTF
jgi:hypothetical protein